MTENKETVDEEIGAWKYEFAWRQLENAQSCNDVLDNKAMNNVNFASLAIPIVAGIFVYMNNKVDVGKWGATFVTESLFFLVMSILFAYASIWLKDHGVIQTSKHFEAITGCVLSEILDGTSIDLSNWQKKVLVASKNKSMFLFASNILFMIALVFIVLSFGVVLLF